MPRFQLDINDIRQLPLTHSATITDDFLDDLLHMNVMWYTHLFSKGMGQFARSVGLALDQIKDRQRIVTRIAEGEFESEVVNLNQLELFE